MFKKTKIIATIGPSTNSYDSILELIKAGANGIRMNFSHGTHKEREQQVKWIRKASKEYGKPIAIVQDLQGPKIRLGDFEGVIPVQEGQSLSFKYNADYDRSGHIPTQYDLSTKVKRGQRLLLYDGKVNTIVSSVKDGVVYATVQNDGLLLKRKGINLPDTDFGGDIITDKDREDIAYGSTVNVDYVSLSFIQSATDVRNLRKMLKNLGSKAKVIGKIETSAAIENIEEIVQESDAIMIARGDLAIETMHESVPVMQRRIIALGQTYRKPTIVATHMMASMTESPEPTRAEVSDVSSAVIFGADCVMLSDETASGKYPIEAVKMMKKIIKYTEHHSPQYLAFQTDRVDDSRQSAICHSIIELAQRLDATAIVAETKSGATAFELASRRPSVPIIAVTSDPWVCNQLALCYGTKVFLRPDNKYAASKLTDWLLKNNVLSKGDVIVTSSGKYPGVVGTTDTIKVRVL
ncbi:pyruvate kinase [Candidatus Saccharibacteria bacterium]|nr:pyruvate kinase [Candidatus Saccharibacteria bacterium]